MFPFYMLSVSLPCAFVCAPLREDRVTFGRPLLLSNSEKWKVFCLLGRTVLLIPSLSVSRLSAHQFNTVINLKSCIKICTQC